MLKPEQVKEALQKKGLSADLLDTFTDEQLVAIAETFGEALPKPDPKPKPKPAEGESFEEESGMDRDQLIAELVALGEDEASLEGMSDEELTALLQELQEADEGSEEQFMDETLEDEDDPEEEMPLEEEEIAGDPTMEEMPEEDYELEEFEEGVEMEREMMVELLTSMGHDPAELEGYSDEELAEMIREGGDTSTEEVPAGGGQTLYEGRSGFRRSGSNRSSGSRSRQPAKVSVTTTYAERQLQREVAQMRCELATEKKRRKRAKVNTFCERLLRSGKLIRAEMREVKRRLMRASDQAKTVTVFSDGKRKRKRMSELDQQMRELSKRPVIFDYSEKVPTSESGKTALEQESRVVRRFCEQHSEQLKRYRETPEGVAKTFEEQAKKRPGLKGREFLAQLGFEVRAF